MGIIGNRKAKAFIINIIIIISLFFILFFTNPCVEDWLSIDRSKGVALLPTKPWPRSRSSTNGLVSRFPGKVLCVAGEGAAPLQASPWFLGRGALQTRPQAHALQTRPQAHAVGHATTCGACRACVARRWGWWWKWVPAIQGQVRLQGATV